MDGVIRDFTIVAQNADMLLLGLANTAVLSFLTAVLSLGLGLIYSIVLMAEGRCIRALAQYLLDTIRCIPALLLIYVFYYLLPEFGIVLNNWTAGLCALVICHTAYMAEIIRGSWVILPKEHIETAISFGFRGPVLYRRIIFPPIILSAAPMIGNQIIIIVKDTAFLTIIAVSELTHAATSIQSRYYVPFAAYASAIALYWVLCRLIGTGVSFVERVAEARRR
jgi:polar amino acid transport system permease protein